MRILCVLCALAATVARGDTLRDVNATVARLSGSMPVRATLTIEQDVKTAGRFANDKAARLATAEVSQDQTGVSITIPQSLINLASQQIRSANTVENSAEDAIGSIRTLGVVEALNFRDSFLTMLQSALATEEKRVVFRGQNVRMLALKLSPSPRKKSGSLQVGTVKSDDRLTLWIGDDNVPLAAERVQKTTAGILFVQGSFSSRTSYTFTHMGDRLLLTRVETIEGGSGMGQNVERKSTQTLMVH